MEGVAQSFPWVMLIFICHESGSLSRDEIGFYTSCSDISQKLPQKFSKVAQKLLISRKSCSKVAFYQLKKITFYYR